ncbi:MAG TPA: ABC transporter ATP-binding protein [Nitrososphaerales archaeon]|nr:ABC transporter ATP-binding protein [Nitrososphaerales archaeon]
MAEVLEIRDFSFKYPESDAPAVSHFQLKVAEGEIVILAGPSGCGKSTLLRAVNGLIPHMYLGEYSGSVVVGGSEVSSTPMRDLAQKVGYLFQNPENQIFMFSVERDVAFGLENLGTPRKVMRERVDEVMEQLGITHLAGRAPHELSDGQKQRVALAGVLAMRPRLVILDEPTSLLDPMTASELVSLVAELRKSLGTTFIVVEHRLDLFVRVSDRIVVMKEGKKVREGVPSVVLSDPDVSGYGLSVPPVTALQTRLRGDGWNLPERLLTPEELAAAVEGKRA